MTRLLKFVIALALLAGGATAQTNLGEMPPFTHTGNGVPLYQIYTAGKSGTHPNTDAIAAHCAENTHCRFGFEVVAGELRYLGSTPLDNADRHSWHLPGAAEEGNANAFFEALTVWLDQNLATASPTGELRSSDTLAGELADARQAVGAAEAALATAEQAHANTSAEQRRAAATRQDELLGVIERLAQYYLAVCDDGQPDREGLCTSAYGGDEAGNALSRADFIQSLGFTAPYFQSDG